MSPNQNAKINYSAADTIHLVLDNLNTHTRKALVDRFGQAAGGWLWERFTVHYTPKHGSWLNQAEIEIGLFSRQCLGKRRIGNIATHLALPTSSSTMKILQPAGTAAIGIICLPTVPICRV
jgi:DDE superfamily endonuclease